MLAVSYQGPYRITMADKPPPRVEHPDDALVRVTRAAICGSDLHLLHGLVADTRVGATFGHEFTGVVEEVGPGVRQLKPGDRVVVPFNISCGTCFYCQRGLTGNCDCTNPNSDLVSGVFGYSHSTGGYEGGQAEYVRVPFADVGPVPIPEDLSDEQALFLGDILPTGYQGAEMASIRAGQTVAVFGAGPVGLFAMKCAWLMGAGRVIAIDRVGYRLELARRFANAETLNFEETDDVIGTLKELTEGRGPDACIDAVGMEAAGSALHNLLGMKLKLEAGAATALAWSIFAARKGGVVSVIGVYGPPWNLVPLGAAMNKGLTLRMNQCNVKRYIPRLIEHIRERRVDPTAIITHRFRLQDAPAAYQAFDEKRDGCVKCVLLPH